MKVSYSWLKDFVDIKISPQKLADKLTMAGLSVASLEEANGDWVYDIEVVSNRPDWLSIRGIAREIAAITGGKLKKSPDPRHGVGAPSHQSPVKTKKNQKPSILSSRPFSISIDDKKGCTLYYGNLITGVKVGPSPKWLKDRLQTLGLRSVNNVVDITNYCLMEYGQPLHAFDFDKIEEATIIIRRATKGERIVLIDGSEKNLNNDCLVIADSVKPIAVAGIMGVRDTEVSLSTTEVLLESACFDPVVVRRGTRILGVASDSSYRFERGVDIPGVQAALERATAMICDYACGTLVSSKHCGRVQAAKENKIRFTVDHVRDVLGMDLSSSQVRTTLEKLGLKVKVRVSDIFEAAIPTYRRDLKIQEDITEEIARVFGFDKIPLTTPSIKPFSLEAPLVQILEKMLKDLLVSMGLKEVITYSLISEEDYKKSSMSVPKEAHTLENPLSQDYSILRTTLLPSVLGCIFSNVNHNRKDLEIFEINHLFYAEGGRESQRTALAIGLCGLKRSSWQKESGPYTFFDLKGVLETLLDQLQIQDYEFKVDENFLQQGKGCRLIAGGKQVACFGQIPEAVKRGWGIKCKEDVFVAEVSVDALATLAQLKKSFKALSSTPSIFRDISLLAHKGVTYDKIKELIQRKTQGYLKDVSLVECYQGKEIPLGSMGLTISLEYGSGCKTLTDNEINPIHQKVLDCLISDLSLKLR